jgi:chaperonin cofactor prefoldin
MSMLNPINRPSSKKPSVPANASDRRVQTTSALQPWDIIAGYVTKIKTVDAQIKRLEPNFRGINNIAAQLGIFTEFGFLTYVQAKAKLESLRKEKAVLELRLRTYRSSIEPPKKTTNKNNAKNNAASPPKAPPTTGDSGNGGKKNKPVIYNASVVKSAYFDPTQSLFNSQADPKGYSRGEVQIDSSLYSGNTPAGAVKSALELWQNSTSGKGMIQTWFPNGKPPAAQGSQTWSNMGASKKVQRYGFQFQYNPGNISMTYGGVPDTDVGMLTSGTEEYLSANPSIWKSTINFNVLINRMFDMQHLGPGGKIKGGVPVSSLYSGNIPTAKDLKKIYNRGTMYDVEFLLQSMFAFSPVSTEFRNKTWDVGFLGGFPVEMHLGNKLRYVVLIDAITVDHVIFDHRMVPMFTNISIAARRIPDFKAGVIKDLGSSGADSSRGSNNFVTPVVPGGGSLIGEIGRE